MKSYCSVALAALAAGLGIALVAAAAAPPAAACGWVYYEGYKPKSKARAAVEDALAKRKWKQALALLVAQEREARAHRREADERRDHGGWMWKDEGWFYYQMATAHYQLGDMKRALAAVQSSVKALRDNGHGWDKRDQVFLLYGQIQRARGKRAHAIKLLRLAIRANKKDPRLWSTLGTIQEEAGDLAAAEASLAKAVALAPDHHGGMEWVHLEVVRFKRQLARDPESYETRPFLHGYAGNKTPEELAKARAFARSLAPELPIPGPAREPAKPR